MEDLEGINRNDVEINTEYESGPCYPMPMSTIRPGGDARFLLELVTSSRPTNEDLNIGLIELMPGEASVVEKLISSFGGDKAKLLIFIANITGELLGDIIFKYGKVSTPDLRQKVQQLQNNNYPGTRLSEVATAVGLDSEALEYIIKEMNIHDEALKLVIQVVSHLHDWDRIKNDREDVLKQLRIYNKLPEAELLALDQRLPGTRPKK